MKNKVHANLMLVAWTVGFLTLTTSGNAQELRKEGRYFVAEVEQNFKVDKGGELRIYEIRGDVKIQSWAKMEVFVKEVKKDGCLYPRGSEDCSG